jgi:hypothetical protein
MLPHIFDLTKRSKIDDAIGQLSYPIYLCHLLVIQFVAGSSPLNAILGSAVGATLLVLLFAPIELVRRSSSAATGGWKSNSLYEKGRVA